MRRVLVLAIVLVACADADDEMIGETRMDLAGVWSYSWGCSLGCELDMGTDVNRTCFLSGVRGNLTDDTAVRVYRSGGTWRLRVEAFFRPLMGDAVCISTALNRTGVYSVSGSGSTLIGAGTAQRRCFLTEVGNAHDENVDGFMADGDYARVWKFLDTWYLSSIQEAGAGSTVSAMCVDVPENHGSWLWIAGNPGSRLDNLASNPSPGGVACGMTGMGGHFAADDYTDGVWIQYNDAIDTWQQKTVNGKRAWSTCVK